MKLVACVAPNGVLHASAARGECLPGHRELDLSDEDDETCELCDPFDDDPDRSADQRDGLARRIDALEKSAYLEVVAPFEVLREDGKPVLKIDDMGIDLFNRDGKAVATIVSGEGTSSST
jgi:hypothetical protein